MLCIFMFSLMSYAQNEMTAQKKQIMRHDIITMTNEVCKDLQMKGPIAWLDYFEKSDDFFMVNDGMLAFPDNQTAATFISDTLTKMISKINLTWSAVKIDILCENYAGMSAEYDETLTNESGKSQMNKGYFTATLHLQNSKWKFRNLHWSSLK